MRNRIMLFLGGEGPEKSGRVVVAFVDLVVVLGLPALAIAYLKGEFDGLLPDSLKRDGTQYLVPRAAWFGAFGGVTYSMKGVFEHRKDWDSTWNLWHLLRPVSGAIAGLITYFALLLASDSAPRPETVYVGTFVLGMQERRFFGFLYRIAEIIVQTATDEFDKAPVVRAVNPPNPVVGSPVVIHGKNFSADASVSIDGTQLTNVKVAEGGGRIDGEIAAGVKAGGHQLIVATSSGSAQIKVTVT